MIAAAVAAALIPLPAPLVEKFYSSTAYPRLQTTLTTASNQVPFALLDGLIVLAAFWWLLMIAAELGRPAGWGARTASVAARTITGAATLFLLFLACWGLNYRRVPLAQKLEFDAHRVSQAGVVALAGETVRQLNALHGPAHAGGWSHANAADPALVDAFVRALRDVGLPPARAGNPKHSLLDLYFRRAGVSGMTDPFFLETLVTSGLLPFERPFVIAHEWMHLAGVTDEGEANFLGWLACLRGGPRHRYSAWLFLYDELRGALDRSVALSLAGRLEPGPRADLDAIRRRLKSQISPPVASAALRVYDQYLKANRVAAGTASYGEVVRLLLGVRFTGDWRPTLRSRAE